MSTSAPNTIHAPSRDGEAGAIDGRRLDGLPDLLTVKELSVLLQVPVKTLYEWKLKEYGPAPIKIGKYLRYPASTVRGWLSAQTSKAA